MSKIRSVMSISEKEVLDAFVDTLIRLKLCYKIYWWNPNSHEESYDLGYEDESTDKFANVMEAWCKKHGFDWNG